jgi:hypothetical protein
MNFAKTVFAIFASVLLVGTQSVSAFAEKSPAKSQVCGCCACKKMDCCVAQPASTPEPVPAAPVRTQSQNNAQFIAVVASLLLQTDSAPAPKISSAPSASFPLTSVPLYEWNCSYLI